MSKKEEKIFIQEKLRLGSSLRKKQHVFTKLE